MAKRTAVALRGAQRAGGLTTTMPAGTPTPAAAYVASLAPGCRRAQAAALVRIARMLRIDEPDRVAWWRLTPELVDAIRNLAERVRQGYAAYYKTDEDTILERFQAKIPLGRYSTTEEVAGLVGYLASDTAASITAQALNVCGGLGNY